MNKYRQHIFVLLEDDANRQLANGFLLDVSSPSYSQDEERMSGGEHLEVAGVFVGASVSSWV
jgi:hypothetical protein